MVERFNGTLLSPTRLGSPPATATDGLQDDHLLFGCPEDKSPTTIFSEELGKRLEQVLEFARHNLKVTSDRMKERYDKDTPLEEGEPVWVYILQRKKGILPKLIRTWKGPYLVIKRINDLVYHVQLIPRSKHKVLHRNRLWRYTGLSPPTLLKEQDGVEGDISPATDMPLQPRRSNRQRKPRGGYRGRAKGAVALPLNPKCRPYLI